MTPILRLEPRRLLAALACGACLLAFGSALGGQDFEVMTVQEEVGVREKPGFIYKETGRLLPGEEVIVTDTQGDWVQVANLGWIPAKAVGFRKGIQRYEVTVETARLRAGPGTTYEIKDSADQGTILEVVDRQGEWLETRNGSWIYESLVRRLEEGPGAEAPGSEARERRIRIQPDRVNLRAGPSTDTPVVNQAAAGDLLEVLREKDGWYETPRGWIRGDLAAPAEASAQGPGPGAGGQPAELRQWGLLSLLGVYIKLVAVPEGGAVAVRTQESLNRLTGQDRQYTFMTVVIDVPPTTNYRFSYSPSYNRVQVTDSRGRRFGNFIQKEGDLHKLPEEVRSLFRSTTVFPGNVHTGLLAFSGDLDPSDIQKVEIYIAGRMQELYEEG